MALQTNFEHLSIAVYGSGKPSEDEELAMMEIEMFFKCYWQFIRKIEDLASFILTISKAVAQIPLKYVKKYVDEHQFRLFFCRLQQQDRHMLQSEYFGDSNKDKVKVDKNGNGLGRLWQQMLTMFPLARLEKAEAITAHYPTLFSLFTV